MPRNDREVEIEDDAHDARERDLKDTRRPVDEDDAARKSREAVFGKDDEAGDEFEREEDSRLAYDEDAGAMRDDERDGASRRQRRNRARREARRIDASIIAAQNERIQRLEGSLMDMGRAQLGLHAGGIDQQIAEAQGHLAQIDDAYAQAVLDQDKVRITRALRLRDEAAQRIVGLGLERRRVEGLAQQQVQSRAAPQAEVDPKAAEYSSTFMDRHPWFDPTDNTDEDSQMVKAIDDTLVNEGYKPNTARYWRELERRVERRKLGQTDHRHDDYGADNDDYDDGDYDERPSRQRRDERRGREQERSGGLPPRSQRGGGGGSRRVAFDERKLPPLAKDTLDQLGLLDKNGLSEDQLKERQGYIDTWRKGLKAADEAQRNR
jgi:hypothetical protein